MTWLRTLLLALAVILAPQATVAHAVSADEASTSHAMASAHHAGHHRDVLAADVTDCCEATAQSAPGCGIDLVAVADTSVVLGTRLNDRPNRGRFPLRDGVSPEALLDPPRL